MTKKRVPETAVGIVGQGEVELFDILQSRLKDLDLLPTNAIIQNKILSGEILEIGPGPGYLGIEWLEKTIDSKVRWLEISDGMLNLANKNAQKYQVADRVSGVIGDVTKQIPFGDESFDGVFSCNSLHEWQDPVVAFNEIYRVLKKETKFFVSDLKRNTSDEIYYMMASNVQVDEKGQKGLMSSIEASYTKDEILEILSKSNINDYTVNEEPFGIKIIGCKK